VGLQNSRPLLTLTSGVGRSAPAAAR
jgi:hypothetical protein